MKNLIVWVILGIIALFVFSVAMSGCSTFNKFVRFEEQIVATDKDMENVHGSIYNNIKSQGLTVDKYGDLVIKAIQTAMSGRYGAGGSGAAFQWIQEQNPQIDADTFKKLQMVIEAGYNRFEAVQRTKIDVIRGYKTQLRTFPSNIWANIFGFPKINLEDLEKVISTEESKEMMKTKNMKTINPFGENK